MTDIAASAFPTKPFTAAVEIKEFTEQWIAAENRWKKGV